MGDLILMSRADPRPARVQTASAEILFFTGVRYYRIADEMPRPLPAAATGGKRDRTAVRRRRAEPAGRKQLEATL